MDNHWPRTEISFKNPVLIKTLLQTPSPKPEDKQTFVDAYLLGIAKSLGKSIHGLEDIEDQMNIFFSSSLKEQRSEILEILEYNSEVYQQQIESLVDVYSKGDIEDIQNIIETGGWVDSIMIKRNHVMANSIDSLMQTQTMFAAVGCAHLPGKNGIIDLLEKSGYSVSRVKSSFTGIAEQFKVDPSEWTWVENRNDSLGYKISAPGEMFDVNLLDGVDMKMYYDISSELGYGIFIFDTRGESDDDGPGDKLATVISNYEKSGGLKSNKKIRQGDYEGAEVVIIRGKTEMLVRFFEVNEIVYGLFVSQEKIDVESSEADFFFNTFEPFKPLPKKQVVKERYFVDEVGAFQVKFPAKPRKITQQSPYTTEEGGTQEIPVTMYLSSDLSTFSNYIVGYNDYPVGYYLERPNYIYQDWMSQMEEQGGKILGPMDTVQVGDYEGRSIKIELQGFILETWIIPRGNRVYKLIYQYQGDPNESNEFHNSFSFIPFQESELQTNKPDGKSFEFSQFPELDTQVLPAEGYLGESTVYSMLDPKSGVAYIFQHASINPYFRINEIDAFYTELMDALLSWNDSIKSYKDVIVDQSSGRDLIITNKLENTEYRVRFLAGRNRVILRLGVWWP